MKRMVAMENLPLENRESLRQLQREKVTCIAMLNGPKTLKTFNVSQTDYES